MSEQCWFVQPESLRAVLKQSWGCMESGLLKLFLCILSVRDTSLFFLVFCAITLIFLIQRRNSSPGLI